MERLRLSNLPHTWIFDLDGTIVKHNGYKDESGDILLLGVREFFGKISQSDMIIFITSRPKEMKEQTENFLKENMIRFDFIVYDAPFGERVLINDDKPSGLKMAYAINKVRDSELNLPIEIDCFL